MNYRNTLIGAWLYSLHHNLIDGCEAAILHHHLDFNSYQINNPLNLTLTIFYSLWRVLLAGQAYTSRAPDIASVYLWHIASALVLYVVLCHYLQFWYLNVFYSVICIVYVDHLCLLFFLFLSCTLFWCLWIVFLFWYFFTIFVNIQFKQNVGIKILVIFSLASPHACVDRY